MKYLLVVEFLCEIYRKEPRARIFLNDQLLDEFFVEQNNSNNVSETTNPTTLITTINNLQEFGLRKAKIFELDIPKSLNDVIIKIEIENNDNNYTNGFMTRYTQLILEHFYLIPLNSKLIARLRAIRRKRQFSENYALWQSQKQDIMDLILHTSWHEKEKKIDFVPGQIFGTNGKFICKLHKKYGFLIPKEMHPSYIYNMGPNILVLYLLDKYKENEDK
jgi:hypothetical protein